MKKCRLSDLTRYSMNCNSFNVKRQYFLDLTFPNIYVSHIPDIVVLYDGDDIKSKENHFLTIGLIKAIYRADDEPGRFFVESKLKYLTKEEFQQDNDNVITYEIICEGYQPC